MADILLTDSGDGGDLVFNNGDIATDSTYGTAIYISFFGGNMPSDIFDSANKNTREVIEALTLPVTPQNLLTMESACNTVLQWMISDGLVDDAKTEITAEEINEFKIDTILTEGKTQTRYTIYWDRITQNVIKYNELVEA
jgi:phage gp46-like protein